MALDATAFSGEFSNMFAAFAEQQKIFQDILDIEIEESVKNISSKSEDQVKQWIKEGTLTDKLLVSAIKNVMKERINNG